MDGGVTFPAGGGFAWGLSIIGHRPLIASPLLRDHHSTTLPIHIDLEPYHFFHYRLLPLDEHDAHLYLRAVFAIRRRTSIFAHLSSNQYTEA